MPQKDGDWLKFGNQKKYRKNPRYQAPFKKGNIFSRFYYKYPKQACLIPALAGTCMIFSRQIYETYREARYVIKLSLGHYDYIGEESNNE